MFDTVDTAWTMLQWFGKRLFRYAQWTANIHWFSTLDYANNLVDRTINRKRHSEMRWIISIHQDSEFVDTKLGCLTLSRRTEYLFE